MNGYHYLKECGSLHIPSNFQSCFSIVKLVTMCSNSYGENIYWILIRGMRRYTNLSHHTRPKERPHRCSGKGWLLVPGNQHASNVRDSLLGIRFTNNWATPKNLGIKTVDPYFSLSSGWSSFPRTSQLPNFCVDRPTNSYISLFNMVQIKRFVAFFLVAAATTEVVALPFRGMGSIDQNKVKKGYGIIYVIIFEFITDISLT